MSFNPTFSYTPARQLIIPNTGTEGWKILILLLFLFLLECE